MYAYTNYVCTYVTEQLAATTFLHLKIHCSDLCTYGSIYNRKVCQHLKLLEMNVHVTIASSYSIALYIIMMILTDG